MTSPDDVALAVMAGADAVGVIVADSPRQVALGRLRELAGSIPPLVGRVGVVAGESVSAVGSLRDLGFTIQFHGPEPPSVCERLAGGQTYIKVAHILKDVAYGPDDFASLDAYENGLVMFDARAGDRIGGTGEPFFWAVIEPAARRRPVIVAGGLTPENVGACIAIVHPYAVDVRSGIETEGIKDLAKMQAFVEAVRTADAQA